MSTDGDKDQGSDKGIRILSLGMQVAASLEKLSLTAPIQMVEVLEHIPSY
jgi:hypothetical protein